MSVRGQAGFVLVSTLWVLAIVLIIAAGFDAFVEQKIGQATLLKDNLQRRLDEYATQETVSYLLMTQRYTRAGLTTRSEDPAAYQTEVGHYRSDPIRCELLLDGTQYAGLGSTCFAIQDQAGLIGLGSASAADLRWLLDSTSSRQQTIDRLIDSLLDYVDKNDSARLNGAEREDYQNRSLPPPSNYFLRSPNELFRVMNWSEWLTGSREFLWWRWLSIRRSAVINLNTLPDSLVMRLPATDRRGLQRMIDQRRERPYRSVEDFDNRAGLRLDWPSEKYRFLASNRVQLHIRSRESRRLTVIGLELTPNGLLGPLQRKFQYETTVPSAMSAAPGARDGLENGAGLGVSRSNCTETAVRLF